MGIVQVPYATVTGKYVRALTTEAPGCHNYIGHNAGTTEALSYWVPL